MNFTIKSALSFNPLQTVKPSERTHCTLFKYFVQSAEGKKMNTHMRRQVHVHPHAHLSPQSFVGGSLTPVLLKRLTKIKTAASM